MTKQPTPEQLTERARRLGADGGTEQDVADLIRDAEAGGDEHMAAVAGQVVNWPAGGGLPSVYDTATGRPALHESNVLDRPAGKTILVDGPMAGHLHQVPDDCLAWMVRVPQPLRIPVTSGPEATFRDEIAYYRTATVVYNHDTGRYPARVGWTGPSAQPEQANLIEHVPTGLAEQGMLPWPGVPVTAADRATPVGIEAFGDPLKECVLERIDASWGWLTDLAGVCACGWRTERVPMNRRAQLVRAAGWHKSTEETRRARFHLPIQLLSEGCGVQPDCYGGMSFDKDTLLARGVCRRCGWETERVEPYRTGPLQKLCQAHTGPDGVRRVRNQLLAAYGLPLPDEGEEVPDAAG